MRTGIGIEVGFHTGECGQADTDLREGPLDFVTLTISQIEESPLSHMDRQKLT